MIEVFHLDRTIISLDTYFCKFLSLSLFADLRDISPTYLFPLPPCTHNALWEECKASISSFSTQEHISPRFSVYARNANALGNARTCFKSDRRLPSVVTFYYFIDTFSAMISWSLMTTSSSS